MSSGLAGSAGFREAVTDLSPFGKASGTFWVGSCRVFPRSWARASVLELTVSKISKSNASLLLGELQLSVSISTGSPRVPVLNKHDKEKLLSQGATHT